MKKIFAGYYSPEESEYKKLWEEGIIVLDTNVLLDLYRLPASARDEFLAVLTTFKGRIWIPFHVALEFQRNRLIVISSERKSTEDALIDANELFGKFSKKFEALQIDKRGLELEAKPLIEDLKRANNNIIQAIEKAHQAQLDITMSDIIRDKLDELLLESIGRSPANQAEIDSIVKDGDERFKNRIPPGFADAEKDKNPNDSVFYHGGIFYQRKFGDLILWRQLIEYIKEKEIKSVLLVTADRKEDWWWREKGKTIGPHPELSNEIARLGGVDLFWMYSSVQFLENAKKFTVANVSEEAVAELKEVTRQEEVASRNIPKWTNYIRSIYIDESRKNERVVFEWLKGMHENIKEHRGFPDFIVDAPDGFHGYEVKSLRGRGAVALSGSIINSVTRGYAEVNEGRLSKFSLILILSEENYSDSKQLDVVDEFVMRFLVRYPIYEIIMGYVDSAEEFIFIGRRAGR